MCVCVFVSVMFFFFWSCSLCIHFSNWKRNSVLMLQKKIEWNSQTRTINVCGNHWWMDRMMRKWMNGFLGTIPISPKNILHILWLFLFWTGDYEKIGLAFRKKRKILFICIWPNEMMMIIKYFFLGLISKLVLCLCSHLLKVFCTFRINANNIYPAYSKRY